MTSRLLLASLLLASACTFAGCASAPTPVKAGLTPLTVVRDLVDVPLVSVTNAFEFFADNTRPARTPHAGVGWSWRGGINFGIGYDLSHYLFRGLSWTFGAIDYIPCRSLYPNWPNGVSPWRGEGESWGSLYFPNTNALWADPIEQVEDNRPVRPAQGNPFSIAEPVNYDMRDDATGDGFRSVQR